MPTEPVITAFGGYITNIAALRSELGLNPDADERAVLRCGWRAWSDRLFGRVDGVWSVAIADEGGWHLYRDPSGLAGLYWSRTPAGDVIVATGIDSLHRLAVHPDRIRRTAVHEYLRLLDIAAPATICESVHAVVPGQILHVDAQGELAPLAEIVNPGAQPQAFTSALDELDLRLRQSVGAALATAECPAAFLSGGVDSTLLCALASAEGRGLTALTVGFDADCFDEAPAAERIAQRLGIPHEVLRFSREDCLAAFDRLARHMDQPMADPASMVTLLAFDHCRTRFDVVLDGTGADEAVGAMPPRHKRLAVEFGSLVPAPLRRTLTRTLAKWPSLAAYTPLLDFEHPAETLMRWNGFTRAEVEQLCEEPAALGQTTFYRTFARFPRRAHFERYSALLDAMPSDRLTQAIRLTALRVRFPFCAADVTRVVRQLPTEWRHLTGQPKRILRELLARYVPRDLWDTPKHGFDFPLHALLAGDDYALVRRHLLGSRWLRRGLLRPEAVQRYAQAYIGGNRRLMFRVWALVVLGAWLDHHETLSIPSPRA